MDLGLKEKRALVMGSTRGMGKGIAERLAEEGASVAVCGRNRADADAVAADIAGARAYSLDLSDPASVDALIQSVAADLDGLDIVVCNGGGPPPGNIADVDPDVWTAQFQPMFVSQLKIVNAFLPGMRERRWGRVLVISSSGIVQPIPNLGISNAIRASLVGWAKTLSSEVAADGVTVNTIAPGRIHTDRVDQIDAAAAKKQDKPVDEIVRASHATIPAGRYGTVAEFADTAVYLLSDNASYITGSVVKVDGGMIRGV
ncbi:MAG: SDR family oxidoreductase [Alphaproteobacteria bacterium]